MLFKYKSFKSVRNKIIGMLKGRNLPLSMESRSNHLIIPDEKWWEIILKPSEDKFDLTSPIHTIKIAFSCFDKLEINVYIKEESYFPFEEGYYELLNNLEKDFKIKKVPLTIELNNNTSITLYKEDLDRERIEKFILRKYKAKFYTYKERNLSEFKDIFLSKPSNPLIVKEIENKGILVITEKINDFRLCSLVNIIYCYEIDSEEMKQELKENCFELEIY